MEEESQHCHACAILYSLRYVGIALFYVDDMHLNKTWKDLKQCERHAVVHAFPVIAYLHGVLFSVYSVF